MDSKILRILHVVTYMGMGGLETMLMNYYRQIDRERIQFDFLTHRSFEADYDNEICSLGGTIYHLPRLNPFSLRYRSALREFFFAHSEYRIVHVHQDCMSGVILQAAEECGVPVRIAHSHSSSQDKNLKYPIKLLFRNCIPKHATHLLACGEEAGSWMFRGAPFQIMNNAIDAAAYQYSTEKHMKMREALGIPESTMLVGHVGRFFPAKNHAFLIEIFAEIRKHVPACLLLVGEGDLQEQIKKKVRDLKLEESVIFTGLRSDVNDLMQAMDVFVFPSLYEGIPLTLIEAQASGLPCLISDKVPIACKVIETVEQIPLDAGTKTWAEAAIKAAGKSRMDTVQDIVREGYDIKENTEKLTEWYLNLGKAANEQQAVQRN